MEIKFDKALLWSVPYLYLAAIMYYWGYWGTLDINVFSHYEISDLLKGVIAPLGYVVFLSLLYALTLAIDTTTDKYLPGKASNLPTTAIIAIIIVKTLVTFLTPALLFYYASQSAVELPPAIDEKDAMYVIYFSAMFGMYLIAKFIGKSYFGYEGRLGMPHPLIMGMIFLLLYSFYEGRHEALEIKQNKKFEYALLTGLVYNEQYFYKYLGKVGSHYCFLELSNNNYAMVSSDKIPNLILEKYASNNKRSIARFRVQAKRIHKLHQRAIKID